MGQNETFYSVSTALIWSERTSSSSGLPACSGLTGASLDDPSAAQKSRSAREDPNDLSSSIVLTLLQDKQCNG